MGTSGSANDEWVELYNSAGEEVDLTGWALKAVDGIPEIGLSGTISPQGYFLLERTDDTSAPDVVADLIYVGALSNTGEELGLYDSGNNLIDSIDDSSGWDFGDNSTKQTIEKTDSGWQTSLEIGGTPKAENSNQEESGESTSDGTPSFKPASDYPPTANAGPDITALVGQEIFFDGSQSSDPDWDKLNFFWNFGNGATSTQEKITHAYDYPGQYIVSLSVEDDKFTHIDIALINIYSESVVISEFDPNNNWVELYNPKEEIANLTGWKLNDFTFPENTFVAPNQFLVLNHQSNSNSIQLFYPDGSLASQVDYSEKKEGSCIAFDGNDYFWTKIPTPSATNIISSTGLENGNQKILNNPVIKQSREIPNPDNSVINLAQSSNLSVLESDDMIEDNPYSQQSASLSQTASSSQKSKLILIISIIISGSLLVSWGLILIKNRVKTH